MYDPDRVIFQDSFNVSALSSAKKELAGEVLFVNKFGVEGSSSQPHEHFRTSGH
jgi:hypothetical protein